MGNNKTKEVSTNMIFKHYITSVFIYTILTIVLIFSPLYLSQVDETSIDYTLVLILMLCGYIILAPIFLFTIKPKDVENSRSLTILNYIKRQFQKSEDLTEFLSKIEPSSEEKQALATLFMQAFFGIYSITALCNIYLPSLSYNLDFVKTLFQQAITTFSSGAGIFTSFSQYLIDSGDVWIKLLGTITTIALAISYFSDSVITKNKIKSTDTTPLGILSCILCYYPITILTNKFLFITEETLIPVENQTLLAFLNLFIIIAHVAILIAVLRLGTKSGNLTNRGIETKFPYNIVRHPEYSMQIFYIILTTIPLLLYTDTSIVEKILIICATSCWIYLYYLRAITEERHLIKDEEYKNYCSKTKFRFIPKIF
jgi:protein-S-isoprenylcysteine O-methyltransferase Ste14